MELAVMSCVGSGGYPTLRTIFEIGSGSLMPRIVSTVGRNVFSGLGICVHNHKHSGLVHCKPL